MLLYTDKMYLLEGESNICVYNDTCDDYMKEYKILFCAVTKAIVNGTVYNVIIGDSNFEKLENKIQSFLLNHEIGHIKHDHLTGLDEQSSKQLTLKRFLGFLPKMEIEADCYAASVVGIKDAKYSLLWFVKNKNLPFITRFECLKRYIRIKEVPLG